MQPITQRVKSIFILYTFLVVFLFSSTSAWSKEINFKFINSRIKKITLKDGTPLTIWESTEKSSTGVQIAASTEETAIIAITYLRHFKLYQDKDSLEKARLALRFLYKMQADNGCFYPYMDNAGNFLNNNPDGKVTPGDATAWAFLALAEGSGVVKKNYPGEFITLEDAFLRTFKVIKQTVNNETTGFANYVQNEKMKIPAWLIMGRGDLSALYLLGMSRFEGSTESDDMSAVAKKLGQGIMEFKNIESDQFPLFIHLTYTDKPYIWKIANAFQTAALAVGGQAFERKVWIGEAKRACNGFLVHLAASYGPIDGFYPHPEIYPQTAMGAFTLTENFMAMYNVTGNEDYLRMAGLSAGWFLKNNPTGKPVYSSTDGSCQSELGQDGAAQDKSLKGSAAALLSFMAIYRTKGEDYLNYKQDFVHSYWIMEWEESRVVDTDFEAQEWEYDSGKKGKVAVIRRKNTLWHKFKVDQEDEYILLLSYQKQMMYSSAVAVDARIDGGRIVEVPLGGATEKPYMLMQKVMEPVKLLPGLHTVGIRYGGLLFTLPAVIDCSVLQPVLERRKFVSETGKNIMLVKNMESTDRKLRIPPEIKEHETRLTSVSVDGAPNPKPVKVEKGKKYFVIPGNGYGIMEW
ncbi:MAG: hypothetical protein LWY06_02135 [Firmicutes bacterium]|nr:hypothetical protein [Bacillota bacterium]